MSVLIIGFHDDPHVEALVNSFTDFGEVSTVIGLGQTSDAYDLSWRHNATEGDPSSLISLNGITDDNLNEFRAVVYLPFAVNRPSQVKVSPDENWSTGEVQFAEREWEAAIQSVLWTWMKQFKGPWITQPQAVDLQDRKPFLLGRAIALGLEVPPFEMSQAFSEDAVVLKGRVVGKAINAYQEIDAGTYFNTTELHDDLKPALVGDSPVPNFLQQYVEPRAEYRCFTLFGEVLTVRINRQAGVETPVDLRVVDRHHLQGSQSELSSEYNASLVSLTTDLGLDYCAFDLIEDERSIRLVDINPIGGWYYIDEKYGIGVSDWIVNLIIQEAEL